MTIPDGMTLTDRWPRIVAAQAAWAARTLHDRLSVLDTARRILAGQVPQMAAAIGMAERRTQAASVVSEIIPLLNAIRFLSEQAPHLLRPIRRHHRLTRTATETSREPLGIVGILAPFNYPLFLPGVQTVQALAAGNAVIVKPAPDGAACLHLLHDILRQAGLPPDLFTVTAPDLATATTLTGLPLDLLILTGAVETGRTVMRRLADTLTPSIMELSGCDACIVLPDADADLVIDALAFGLGLNGGATCIAPRRLFLVGAAQALLPRLTATLTDLPACAVAPATLQQVQTLARAAVAQGARLLGGALDNGRMRPLLVHHARTDMAIADADLFAPVLSIFTCATVDEAIAQANASRYALGASLFGPADEATACARRLTVGSVTVNDIIAPTANPALSFGGAKSSGFGTTRGRDGLLSMTRVKTMTVSGDGLRPHLAPPTAEDMHLFTALAQLKHGAGWGSTFTALATLMRLGRGRSMRRYRVTRNKKS